MKYTFEITIAGCSTNCAHCYVDGGPSSCMALDTYKQSIKKLRPVLDLLNGDVAVTLGNEIFCHDALPDIFNYNAEMIPDYYSFQEDPIPTTGIALVNRLDRDSILKQLQTIGARKFMLAVHGAEKSHDEIVCRAGAYSQLFETVDFVSQREFAVLFNMIVSKNLCADFQQMMKQVADYPHASAVLTVPLYVPTKRMKRYQHRRAEYDDCMRLAEMAEKFGMDATALLEHGERHNEQTVIKEILEKGFEYETEKKNAVQWTFFHVTQNGDLYYGNAGAHTQYIGNLLQMDERSLFKEIKRLEANYDYVAYYSDELFFSLEKYISRLPSRTHNYVYKSKQDCIYALLDELELPNALI